MVGFDNAWVPLNSPAIGDLFGIFDFQAKIGGSLIVGAGLWSGRPIREAKHFPFVFWPECGGFRAAPASHKVGPP
jgi:hypothetical protein